MRRLVAALIVALLALSLVGCGGGGEDQAAPPPDENAAPPVTPALNEDVEPVPDRSSLSGEMFEPFPTGDAIPPEITRRLEANQPMLLFFFNPSQKVTNDLRREINSVMSENRGIIDLITYDLGKATSLDDQGQVKVNQQKLANDPSAQQAVSLARALRVDQVPYILVVDDQGQNIFWARGFVDAELLDRQVQRAQE